MTYFVGGGGEPESPPPNNPIKPPINGTRPKPLSTTVLATEAGVTPPPLSAEPDGAADPRIFKPPIDGTRPKPLSTIVLATEAGVTPPPPPAEPDGAADPRISVSDGASPANGLGVSPPAASVKLSSNFSCVVLAISCFRLKFVFQDGECLHLAGAQLPEACSPKPPPHQKLLYQP
jgi:hypothetical protein